MTQLYPDMELPFEAAFRDKSVLVTGHSGFTGGWLCLWLSGLGAQISGLSLAPNTKPSLFEAAKIDEKVNSHIGDIRDFSTVRAVFEKSRPAVVFHLAAQPLVSQSFDDPLETIATNVLGTAHVLEAARLTLGVKAVVCITTDKVYHDRNWRWAFRETDRLGGKDPYSASKAAAEIVSASYQKSLSERSNGVAIATARGGNIIGGGDWSENRIVPDFVRAHVAKKALTLRNPNAVRPWQHVIALCHGYLTLADRLLGGDTSAIDAWNFGPRDEKAKTVGDLVSALSETWPGPETNFAEGGFPETQFLRVDSSCARVELGWEPPISFNQTVQMTAQWYRAYYDNPEQARPVTDEQINAYRQLLSDTE